MSNYRVMLRGIKPGRSVEDVVAALARYSKKSPEQLRAVLTSGRPMVAKRTALAQQATQYKLLLDKLGCNCVIDAEITSAVDESPNVTSVLVTDVADSSSERTPRRGVSYRQRTRLQELTENLGRIVRPRILLGFVILLTLAYFGWKQLLQLDDIG